MSHDDVGRREPGSNGCPEMGSLERTSCLFQNGAGECRRCCVQTGSRYGDGSLPTCRASATKARKVLLVPLRRKIHQKKARELCGSEWMDAQNRSVSRRARRRWEGTMSPHDHQTLGPGPEAEVGLPCLRGRLRGPNLSLSRG